jgi:hypothetical protein
VQVVDSEIAAAPDAESAGREHRARPCPTRLGSVAITVLVEVILRSLACAFPFEFRAQTPVTLLAEGASLLVRDIREWDRSFLVGIREGIDVESLEDDLQPRHLFVGDARK